MIVTIFREDYFEYGLGLLDPHPEDSWDADSEAYFSAIDASQRPDSYSSLAEGQDLVLRVGRVEIFGFDLTRQFYGLISSP
jgi:hypothetical protein